MSQSVISKPTDATDRFAVKPQTRSYLSLCEFKSLASLASVLVTGKKIWIETIRRRLRLSSTSLQQ